MFEVIAARSLTVLERRGVGQDVWIRHGSEYEADKLRNEACIFYEYTARGCGLLPSYTCICRAVCGFQSSLNVIACSSHESV